MSFDFSLAPRVEEWRDRITRFVDDVVIPREQQAFTDGVDDVLRVELQREARAAGLWAPQAPAQAGGGGFAFDEAAVLLEEAGRSLLDFQTTVGLPSGALLAATNSCPGMKIRSSPASGASCSLGM